MMRFPVPKPHAGTLVLMLGAVAWLVIGIVVLFDVLDGVPDVVRTPTPGAASTLSRAVVALRGTATTVPTVAPRLTNTPTVPPTAVSTSTLSAPLPQVMIPAPTIPPLPPSATPQVMVVTATPGSEPAAEAETEPGRCAPPPGWVAYQVEPGDTLFGFQLGAEGKADVQAIMAANCLESTLLRIGQTIYLPEGVAENAPKVDEVSALPGGPSRPANCPCTIQVRPGWRLEQIAAALDNLPVGFSGQDFLAVTAPGAPAPDHWFLGSRPAGKSLEGFMFPGTYTLQNDTSAVQFRDMLLEAFAANISPALQAEATARGLSFWEAVNLASIVQRESYTPSEQKMVASVMHNRMSREMGLAAFVTLQYALGRPGNWWPRITSQNINTDTRYNTSKYRGLPPSPISNPGLDAILAVLYPAQTDYLYFSARCGGGGNFYARTFEEFKQGLECGGD